MEPPDPLAQTLDELLQRERVKVRHRDIEIAALQDTLKARDCYVRMLEAELRRLRENSNERTTNLVRT